MTTKASSQNGSIPIAKLLAMEHQISKLTSEMEKLILISTQHGSRIKELIVASSNSVSQVEMMSTVTTTRFQHMNDLKVLRTNLQAKYEELSFGGQADHSIGDSDGKDAKEFASKINDVQNELSNTAFKTNMDMNKLKMELKSSKKDYDELKRFVTALETKFSNFIEDAKDSGIKTEIKMDDMPEITYQQSANPRRASILNPDSGVPTTPQSTRSRSQSQAHIHFNGPFSPEQHHTSAYPTRPSSHQFGYENHNQHQSPQSGHDGWAGQPIYHNNPFGPAFNFPMPGSNLDVEGMQQLQLQYQQQMYFQHQYAVQQHHMQQQQQMNQHHQEYVPGMPMTDSGLSTHAHTPSGASPTHFHSVGAYSAPHRSIIHGDATSTSVPSSSSAAAALFSSTDPHAPISAAHRIIHPHAQHPHPQSFQYGGLLVPWPTLGSMQGGPQKMDMEAHLLDTLSSPAPSKEEKYYKSQFRALKELILASMESKDLVSLQPAGLDAPELHHRDENNNNTGSNNQSNHVEIMTDRPTEGSEVPRNEALKKFDLRHRNRDLYHNMRKVKEVEKIAMNYADFCVTNAINLVDDRSYHKFKESLAEEGFQRLSGRCDAEKRGEAAVQTDDIVVLDTQRNLGGDNISNSTGMKEELSPHSLQSAQQQSQQSQQSQLSQPEPSSPVLSSMERLRNQNRNHKDSLDNDLAQLAFSPTKPALDFGETIEPVLAQYSSTGRRMSLLQLGCVFEKDLRDPALRFLETSIEEDDDHEDEDDDSTASRSKPSSRGSTAVSPAGGTRPPSVNMLQKIPSFPIRQSSIRRIASSESEHADMESLRSELTLLMDKKLMKLYQALDDRWKGLDATNVNILNKINRFQEVLVDLNNDSQRLQQATQYLSQKIGKVDSRLFDAMEPVYAALEEQRLNVSGLEGLMVDVAKQLKELDNGILIARRDCNSITTGIEDLMGQHRPEQIPIEMILRNSSNNHNQNHHHHHHHHRSNNHSDASRTTAAHLLSPGGGGDQFSDYQIRELHAPVPAASANMSEHELELILRQLKEYATMYEDMINNYEVLTKRLREEDVRKSGNFSLKKPYIPRTLQIKPPGSSLREIINTPVSAMEFSPRPEDKRPQPAGPSAAASVHTHTEVVVHLPHTPTEPETRSVSNINAADGRSPGRVAEGQRQHFASPHRIISEPFRSSSGLHALSAAEAEAGGGERTVGALTRRDLLRFLESSDLSSNIEIVRIKNELARLRNALQPRDSTSAAGRTRTRTPVFPSLFTNLDSSGFSVTKTQDSSLAGSALRNKSPPSRSGKFAENNGSRAYSSSRPVLAGSLLPSSEQHASQRTHPDIMISTTHKPTSPRSAVQVSFEDSSLSGAVSGLVGETLQEGSVVVVDAGADVELNVSREEIEGFVEVQEQQQQQEITSNYHPSAAEDEDGLSENSLSAYEFLLHPHSHPPPQVGEETDFTNLEGILPPSEENSANKKDVAEVRLHASSANIVHSSPRGTLWNAASSIGHTTLNARVHPPAQLPPRSSLLASPSSAAARRTKNGTPDCSVQPGTPSGATNTRMKPSCSSSSSSSNNPTRALGGDGGGGGCSAEAKATSASIQNVDLLLRADAVKSGEMKGLSLSGGVKLTPFPTPSPPIRGRPSIKVTSSSPTVTSPSSAGNLSGIPSSGRVGSAGSAKRGRPSPSAGWNEEQVWRKDYTSNESIEACIASTPSVLLQGGEFIMEEGGVVASDNDKSHYHHHHQHQHQHDGAGIGIAALGGVLSIKTGGSVDYIPANTIRNMGENAFD